MDDDDESVRIAVKALGDMRNSAEDDFVYRVSHLPIVNSALNLYSNGKASSRVVKYGAEMMESSMRAVSRPVIDHLPLNVNQLDEFACRQLDRLERYRSDPDHPFNHDVSMDHQDPNRSSWIEANSPFVHPPPPPPPLPDSRSTTPHPDHEDDHQVAQRSRWQAVLLEAGGLSAALSEESMRRLKYCLQWLQYATTHIDAQILILRDFTATLQPLPPALPSPTLSPSPSLSNLHHHSSSSSSSSADPISPAHMRTLTDVRRDVVNTIRQVVDVVSKYAGGALPEPARARVRGFILKLPQKWASAAGVGAAGNGNDVNGGAGAVKWAGGRYHQHRRDRSTGLDVSPGSSKPVSPMSSPRMARSPLAVPPHHATPPTAGAAMQAAQRILALATESLDMMRGVTGVVKDSLDRADAWVGRLRVVGLGQPERGEGEEQNAEGGGGEDGQATIARSSSAESGGLGLGLGSRSYSTLSGFSDSLPSSSGPPSPGGGGNGNGNGNGNGGIGPVMGIRGLRLERTGGGVVVVGEGEGGDADDAGQDEKGIVEESKNMDVDV